MAPPIALLGPPELYLPWADQAVALAPAPPIDPFVDAMVSDFNEFDLDDPPMGRTENNSATYLSSGNPCLDFFFHVVPSTPPRSLVERLALAWAHDPLITLKLICNLRGVRGIGKSDKEGFYTAALWLFKNHPRTLGCNVGEYAKFGYFKDLPEILYRLLEGPNVRRLQKAEWEKRKGGRMVRKRFPMRQFPMRRFPMRHRPSDRNTKSKKKPITLISFFPIEYQIAAAIASSRQQKEKASSIRLEKKVSLAKRLLDRYSQDDDFRNLHDNISEHFARCLKADIGFLKSGEINKISLAAKWCPSIDSSFDCSTLLCESISRRIYPRDSYPEYKGIEDAHYAYRVRDRMRKEVLVPLRKVLELPEVYMAANDWGSIPYNRVASVAMKRYVEIFMNHDKERFEEYLMNVKSGKTTIAAGALLPHEIISTFINRYGRYYGNDNNDTDDEVAKLQWKRMVDDLLKAGKLENCIAVCDVSGSMNGEPMEVSIALGILVSELSKDPWKGKVITFSEDPQLHLIQGDDLAAKAQFVMKMEWGMNTNFQRVFDLILEVAKEGNLSSDQMVKRVFVFSDMEFDEASANTWETDYQAIRRKFRTAGYEDAVPQIVFWNLRDSSSTPVCEGQDGVALVSGFSKNIMKLFLDNNGNIDPESVMLQAISGEEYQKLAVID